MRTQKQSIQITIPKKIESLLDVYPLTALPMRGLNTIDFLFSTSKNCSLVRHISLLALSSLGTHWKTRSWCERKAVKHLIDEDLLHCLRYHSISENALPLIYERLKRSRYSKSVHVLIQEQFYYYKFPGLIRKEIEGYKKDLLC